MIQFGFGATYLPTLEEICSYLSQLRILDPIQPVFWIVPDSLIGTLIPWGSQAQRYHSVYGMKGRKIAFWPFGTIQCLAMTYTSLDQPWPKVVHYAIDYLLCHSHNPLVGSLGP